MRRAFEFPVILLAAGLVAYVVAGGLGLLLTGLLGFIWRGGPFHTAWHRSKVVVMTEEIRKIQEQQALRSVAKPPPNLYFFDIALCVALIVISIVRMENKGLIGPIG